MTTKVLQFKITTNVPCILRLVLLTDFCGDRADIALRALSKYALLAHLSGGLGEGGDAVVGYAGYIVTCPVHSGSVKHGIKRGWLNLGLFTTRRWIRVRIPIQRDFLRISLMTTVVL